MLEEMEELAVVGMDCAVVGLFVVDVEGVGKVERRVGWLLDLDIVPVDVREVGEV